MKLEFLNCDIYYQWPLQIFFFTVLPNRQSNKTNINSTGLKYSLLTGMPVQQKKLERYVPAYWYSSDL